MPLKLSILAKQLHRKKKWIDNSLTSTAWLNIYNIYISIPTPNCRPGCNLQQSWTNMKRLWHIQRIFSSSITHIPLHQDHLYKTFIPNSPPPSSQGLGIAQMVEQSHRSSEGCGFNAHQVLRYFLFQINVRIRLYTSVIYRFDQYFDEVLGIDGYSI